jgi:hypothetical protein
LIKSSHQRRARVRIQRRFSFASISVAVSVLLAGHLLSSPFRASDCDGSEASHEHPTTHIDPKEASGTRGDDLKGLRPLHRGDSEAEMRTQKKQEREKGCEKKNAFARTRRQQTKKKKKKKKNSATPRFLFFFHLFQPPRGLIGDCPYKNKREVKL